MSVKKLGFGMMRLPLLDQDNPTLAWLLQKVDVPVIGVTKTSHVDGAVKAVDLELTNDETNYLEELYVPHELAGVMAQNGKQTAGDVV